MEIIRDQVIIAAYQRKKEQLKSLDLTADALAPTGDQKMDEKRAKECVYMLLPVSWH